MTMLFLFSESPIILILQQTNLVRNYHFKYQRTVLTSEDLIHVTFGDRAEQLAEIRDYLLSQGLAHSLPSLPIVILQLK